MRDTSSSRDPKRLIRGRKLLSGSRMRKCMLPKPVKPKIVLLEISEIDDSFQKCAYPNMVEILKLSELLNLPPSTIKSEFKKRRELFRQNNDLREDAVISSRKTPRIIMFISFLFGYFASAQQTLLKMAIFISSILSICLPVCWRNNHQNYYEESSFVPEFELSMY